MRPVDAVTLSQAARILGTSKSSARRLVHAGRLRSHGGRHEHRMLSQADVEAPACELYHWRAHTHDPESYWVTGEAAAELMGVSGARMRKMAAEDRLPCVVHVDGIRPYRRAQLDTLANSRDAR